MEPLLEPLPTSTGEVEPRKHGSKRLQLFYTPIQQVKLFCQMFPKIALAPPEEPEPELFLKEPEL